MVPHAYLSLEMYDWKMYQGETFFTTSSIHWATAIIFITHAIMRGVKRIITSLPPEPLTIADILSKYDVDHCFISTTYAVNLAKLVADSPDSYKFPHLKVIGAGGSPIPKYPRIIFKELLPATKLVNLYGLSEGGALITGLEQTLNVHYSGRLFPNVEGKVGSRIMSYINFKLTLYPYSGGGSGKTQLESR